MAPTGGGGSGVGLQTTRLPDGSLSIGANITPEQLKGQETRGAKNVEAQDKWNAESTSATMLNGRIDLMKQRMQTWQPGKFAEWRQDAYAAAQDFGKFFGLNTDRLDRVVGDYQAFMKEIGGMVRDASHEASTRVGVQEMKLITGQLFGSTTDKYGIQSVMANMEGMNDWRNARSQLADRWADNNGGSVGASTKANGQKFENWFNANANPVAFVMHRLQQEQPQIFRDVLENVKSQPGGAAQLNELAHDLDWIDAQQGHGLKLR